MQDKERGYSDSTFDAVLRDQLDEAGGCPVCKRCKDGKKDCGIITRYYYPICLGKPYGFEHDEPQEA